MNPRSSFLPLLKIRLRHRGEAQKKAERFNGERVGKVHISRIFHHFSLFFFHFFNKFIVKVSIFYYNLECWFSF